MGILHLSQHYQNSVYTLHKESIAVLFAKHQQLISFLQLFFFICFVVYAVHTK